MYVCQPGLSQHSPPSQELSLILTYTCPYIIWNICYVDYAMLTQRRLTQKIVRILETGVLLRAF